jgi:predicted GIY-YIG superfamily endonuclease
VKMGELTHQRAYYPDYRGAHFDRPHVLYRIFDKNDQLLYIGITSARKMRFQAHARIQPWWWRARTFTQESYSDRDSAARAEWDAIRREVPIYNVIGNLG